MDWLELIGMSSAGIMHLSDCTLLCCLLCQYVKGLEAKVTSKTEIEEVLAWHTHKGTIEKIM